MTSGLALARFGLQPMEARSIPEMSLMPKGGRYAPPVHMIKLTETREIAPYKWVHPDEER
jgi:hypothetical protein